MKILKEWEANGETIIQVTSEPSTGGAILKKINENGRVTADQLAKGESASVIMRAATTCQG